MSYPSYIALYERGELHKRIEALNTIVTHCTLCPHACKVDRRSTTGKCRTGLQALVASYHAHFGEESCLVGTYGSGTIFFANCNLACIFCQNWDISQMPNGHEVTPEELADMMIRLQQKGCHNINFVSPTHVVHAIIEALPFAIERGLTIPLVYNSGGYDSVETLQLLDGIFDIYMPDFKYMDATVAMELSGARDYPQKAIAALREMHRQVGDLVIEKGIAKRGLLVRHLVMPENIVRSDLVFKELSAISPHTYVNIMAQYRPEYRAHTYKSLGRRITIQEYDQAYLWAKQSGLYRFDR
ncbi:MAG: radical SAM protein [Spirochaetes bacterium]|nr:radical SAM protein [Spirochaetota bacterium]